MLLWRKPRYRCREDACENVTFTEQEPDLVRPRGLLTTRAARWAIGQIRREHFENYRLRILLIGGGLNL